MRKNGTRSPLKDNPLRNPGQSLDEEIDRVVNDETTSNLIAAIMFVLMAAMAWLQRWLDAPHTPEILTVMAVIAVAVTGYKIKKAKSRLLRLKQGRDGERAVGQFLEELRESGFKVFHDVVADNSNIDHVVLSEKGIYLIETKTYSKPVKGDSKIVFDGDTITINGWKPTRNPVVQARASAKWLQAMLLDSTGRTFPIKPVVLFPGWFIETTPQGKASDTWVLEPKAFAKYLDNEKPSIRSEDMHLIKSRISKHIRESNQPVT